MHKKKIFFNILTILLILTTFVNIAQAKKNEDGMIRVLHASPDAPQIDIEIDGDTIVEGLDFKVVTDYLFLAPGEHTVNIYPTGEDDDQPLYSTTLTMSPDKAYTAAAINPLENLDLTVFADETSISEGAASIRVGHLSPDAPSVDVLVNEEVFFSNASYLDLTPYKELTPVTIDLAVNISGTDDTVISFPQTEFEANTLYSIFAVGLAAGEPPLDAVILADPSIERIPSKMPGTGMGGAQNYKEESTILGGILMFLIALTSLFLLFRQQPWNNHSKN